MRDSPISANQQGTILSPNSSNEIYYLHENHLLSDAPMIAMTSSAVAGRGSADRKEPPSSQKTNAWSGLPVTDRSTRVTVPDAGRSHGVGYSLFSLRTPSKMIREQIAFPKFYLNVDRWDSIILR